MKISQFSVYHPIFTVMIFLIVIILGLVSFTRLPIDLMPDITYPTLSLSTSYGNASPEEMEEIITRPIEEALAAVPGVEEISSTSSEGSSRVRVSFAWGTDLEEASNDIRDRLDRIIRSLPEDLERPRLRKFDPASFPILIMAHLLTWILFKQGASSMIRSSTVSSECQEWLPWTSGEASNAKSTSILSQIKSKHSGCL